MAQVSVIIPVYNSEKTLVRCLESVCNQTMKDIEIILVNDGSKDKSLEICSEFADKDNRIKLIDKKNEGADRARQSGLKVASCDYISFVDSDDYIETDMIHSLYSAAKENDADITQCNYWSVSYDGQVRERGSRGNTNAIIRGSANCVRAYVEQRLVTNFLWDKLFKKRVFHNVEHSAFATGEDVCLLVQLFGNSQLIQLIDKPLYHYILTLSSLTRAELNLKQLDSVYASVFVYNYCSKHFPEMVDYARLTICSYAVRYYCKLRSTKLSAEKQREMREIFNKYYLKKNPYFHVASIKRRLLIRLFSFSPFLCCVAYRFVD